MLNGSMIIEIIHKYNGVAIKFSDGTMIQTKYGQMTLTPSNFQSWGNDLVVAEMDLGNWVVPFKDEQLLYILGESNFVTSGPSILNQFWSTCGGIIDRNSAGTFRVIRPNDTGAASNWVLRVFRTAIGRWK